jgi:hypothetical protein
LIERGGGGSSEFDWGRLTCTKWTDATAEQECTTRAHIRIYIQIRDTERKEGRRGAAVKIITRTAVETFRFDSIGSIKPPQHKHKQRDPPPHTRVSTGEEEYDMDGWMDGWEKHTTQIREWMEEERERGRTDDAPNQTKEEEE